MSINKLVFTVIIVFCMNRFYGQNNEAIIYFESNYSKYVFFDTTSINNIWQVGIPQKELFTNSYSYSNVLITDTINNYPKNNISRVIVKFRVPILYYKCVPELYFGFHHKYDTDTMKDGGMIEISFNEKDYYNIFNYDSLNLNDIYFFSSIYTINDTVKSLNQPGFSGRETNWNYVDAVSGPFDISNFAINDSLFFSIRFTFASDSIDNYREGWMIDDIWVNYYNGVSIENLELKNTYIKVFPNPANEVLNVQSHFNFGKGNYKIIDANGKIIMNGPLSGEQNFSIDLEELINGIYFLNISSEKGQFNKVFINRK